MRIIFLFISLFFSILSPINLSAKNYSHNDINVIVSTDGSGDFTTIQAALNSAPDQLTEHYVIYIKNGLYNEKIFINKSFITLIGEDRDSTLIIFPELRKNWRAQNNDSDWGSAVINIADSVTDLKIVNLTVYNNYGSLFNDHDHQFTIRGGGTKIIILNCYIKSDGGDALSLWNTENGFYFHAYSKFEGWVDFVCPRGWCLITESEFFSYSKTASIWHDGSKNINQKFVIRDAKFDGINEFALGRNHRDAQFFLINCYFTDRMADKPIYIVRYEDSTFNKPIYWGERYYYYNCRKEGKDYKWYSDNLKQYYPLLKPEEINSSWVFDNKWNPEQECYDLLPFASFPTQQIIPHTDYSYSVLLKWQSGRDAISHNIYIGEKNNMRFFANQSSSTITIPNLSKNKTYSWRIDEVTNNKIIPGKTWTIVVH